MQLSWAHAVMYVHDLDAMLDFYINILDFELADRGPLGAADGPEIVFLSQSPTDHHQIAFLPVRKDVKPSNSVNHFAFRVATVDDVRTMITRLTEDGRAQAMRPVCHGNAWSIYFQDPEANGIEVFCDTPFHVAQPQGKAWDPAWSDAELLSWTRDAFGNEPEFGALEEFYARRTRELADRESQT